MRAAICWTCSKARAALNSPAGAVRGFGCGGCRASTVQAEREVTDAVGVHEVEALVGEAVEEHGVLGGGDGVPAHVRQHGRLELLHHAGPLAAALGVLTVLDPALEEDLHADADAQHRA